MNVKLLSRCDTVYLFEIENYGPVVIKFTEDKYDPTPDFQRYSVSYSEWSGWFPRGPYRKHFYSSCNDISVVNKIIKYLDSDRSMPLQYENLQYANE